MAAYQRGDNHVKVRSDGQGDMWAKEHRDRLGNQYFMTDIDALFGFEAFGFNSEDRIFMEYEPDSYENRMNVIREFVLISMFDRKATFDAAFHSENKVGLGFQLWICRSIGTLQPKSPKFFFCVGSKSGPPWHLIEIDISTGQRVGDVVELNQGDTRDWHRIWNTLGLFTLRRELRSWLNVRR